MASFMSNPPADPWRYETAIQDIEITIRRIESGELDLEDVVEQFQIASQTLQTCRTFLQQKQAQVDLVIEQLSDPEPAMSAEDLVEDEDIEF